MYIFLLGTSVFFREQDGTLRKCFVLCECCFCWQRLSVIPTQWTDSMIALSGRRLGCHSKHMYVLYYQGIHVLVHNMQVHTR